MRIKPDFRLRTICGQSVVSAEGASNVNFSKLVSLNETAAFLFERFSGVDFTPEAMAEALLEQYEVQYDTALADCRTLCEQWNEIGLLEE